MTKTLDDYLNDPDLANEPLVIETDLSAEEKRLLEQCEKDRKEHPENFTPWVEIRNEVE